MADYTDFGQAQAALNNPSTPAADLAQIAQAQPGLRAQIAAHPAAYDGLLDWLNSLGDPQVSAAVQARRSGGAEPSGPLPQVPAQPEGQWQNSSGPLPYVQPQVGQPGPYPGAPGAYPGYPGTPKPPSVFGQEFGQAFKGVFSKQAPEAVGQSAQFTSPVWAVLGGGHVLIWIIVSLLSLVGATSLFSYGGLFGIYFPWGLLILYGLFTGAALYFGFATGIHIIFSTQGLKLPYTRSLNYTSVAFIPLSIGLLGGNLIGMGVGLLGLGILLVSFLATIVLAYAGIQKAGQTKTNGFWSYILVVGLTFVVLFIVLYLLTTIMVSSMF
ncbi:MAG: hypothetical protein LBR20_04205 [Propionibacteriaceae bacterium]|jgi:hypothetical protein|nr:hypothetical protein [Propionibacteriaceae bacterium]